MHILITRPEPDAAAWRTQLEALGLTVSVDPLLRIELVVPVGLDATQAQGLIATSRNGLRWLADSVQRDNLLHLTVYAVGPGTASLARELGFGVVHEGPASARELVSVIAANATAEAGPLLHLSGDKVAFDLASAPQLARFAIERIVVYRSQPATEFSKATLGALDAGLIDAVTLLSPLAAQTFVSLVSQAGISKQCQQLVYVCLSQNVARCVDGLNPRRVHVAIRPNSDDMLRAIKEIAGAAT